MTSLIKSASATVMKSDEWDIERWMQNVVRDQLAQTKHGLKLDHDYASSLNEPLRQALIKELSFKSYCEDLAARGLCLVANLAPNDKDFQYLLTHTLDESRHAINFAEHLYAVHGKKETDLIKSLNKNNIEEILDPLQALFDEYVATNKNYYCGIALVAIVLEGVLAPSSELSELKWQPFDQKAAQVQRSANEDEIRHLCVCAEIMREGMENSVLVRSEIVECIQRGLKLWSELPVFNMLYERETLYQEGMRDQLALIEDYELAPGILLKETDQTQRIQLASQWSHMMQFERLNYLGIREEVENG